MLVPGDVTCDVPCGHGWLVMVCAFLRMDFDNSKDIYQLELHSSVSFCQRQTRHARANYSDCITSSHRKSVLYHCHCQASWGILYSYVRRSSRPQPSSMTEDESKPRHDRYPI
jgi:hypothetical protein